MQRVDSSDFNHILRKRKGSSSVGWMVQADRVHSSMASKYCALTLQSKREVAANLSIVHYKIAWFDTLSFPPSARQ